MKNIRRLKVKRKKTAKTAAKNSTAAITGKRHAGKEDVKDFAYTLYERGGHERGREMQEWYDSEKAFNKS